MTSPPKYLGKQDRAARHLSRRNLMSAAAAVRVALRRAPRAAPPCRRMGGLTNVKKNAHVEEWNGRREITEKTFDVGRPRTVATLLATIVAFPFVVHHVVKSELDTSKNNCINPKTKAIGTA